MGRIDEAMNRANLDAGLGTGAATPAPGASPWDVEPADRRETLESGAPVAVEAAAAETTVQSAVSGVFEPAAPGRLGYGPAERLVVSPSAGPLQVEQFRSLAATLIRARSDRDLKSVLITSPAPGDGKSHVAVNLALTLSESYRRRVMLIDADIRRPTLHDLFRVRNSKGLSEALKPNGSGTVATLPVSDTLVLLPAGRPEQNPLGGLSSDRLKQLIADAASRFEWVIVDSPPVVMLADAHLVSEAVDAVILVVRAGVTRFPDVQAAAETLGHERLLGIVLNAVDPDELPGKGYYNEYYGGGRAER
jgi:capsular exopolysaccharide synthesis family protein